MANWNQWTRTHIALISIKPLPSKQFRSINVLKTLRDHFKCCWEYEKSKSPKLAFYHAIKQNFQKEPYLDNIKNASNRYRTTRLRISAHDFEIESGRYKGIPRDERICKWCQISIYGNFIEDERHVLYTCDLYGELRNKLISSLNKPPNFEDPSPTFSSLNISPQTLEDSLMKLLSPNVTMQFDKHDPLLHHHIITHVYSDSSNSKLRSNILNAIGSFIANCYERRWSFLTDLSTTD